MRRNRAAILAGSLLLLAWPFSLLAEAAKGKSLEKRVEQLEEELQEVKKTKDEKASTNDSSREYVQAIFGLVKFGAFVDIYYAYDFKEPPTMDRVFTTQPSRHNEFNVNLAYIEAKVAEEQYRGRLALQVGTSVDANYAAEPEDWAKFIQEAYAGYSPIKDLWIDAGIYLSHIGLESFISRDNWTYSRSLAADFSPYYQTGIRISYQWFKAFGTQLHLLNGWQNITDTNAAKAIGMQMAFQPNEHFSLTYNNFLGKEVGDKFRQLHDFVAKVSFLPVDFAAVYDFGVQERDPMPGDATWHVATLLARYQIHPMVSITARGERFFDKEQSIVVTHTPQGFQVWGASGNVDVQLLKNLVWRNEYRHFWSEDRIYPNKTNGSKQDHFVVTSLALSF